MGLFDKILGTGGSETFTLNEREAFAAILLLVMTADGYVTDEEAMGFHALVNRMKLFKDQSGNDFRAMMDRLMGLLKRRGSEKLFEKALAALPPNYYDTVFAVATDLILSDGIVEAEEKEILINLKNAFKITDDLAIKIVEVMRIKNRG